MITFKKSLGQHFLKDENISKKIVLKLGENQFTQLLEIGPGGGALTKHLLQLPSINFKAVELDEEKVKYLESEFPQLKNRVIHEDFLDIDPPFSGRFTIVGNFPYNISSQIVFKIIEWKEVVENMIGMFQKEVAHRIVAKEGNKIYGVISVLTQAFFKAEYLFEVSENAFIPPPKVKSAVIRLQPLNEPVKMRSENDFFLLVKTAFNQRRKTLRNAVRNLFEEEVLHQEIFDKRAEQLKVQEFGSLTYQMK